MVKNSNLHRTFVAGVKSPWKLHPKCSNLVAMGSEGRVRYWRAVRSKVLTYYYVDGHFTFIEW